MALKIEDLFNQADAIIESKGGQEKTASQKPVTQEDEDVMKIANALMAEEDTVKSTDTQPTVDKGSETLIEKVAKSIAVTEVLMNMDELKKIAQLEKAAQEKGIPQEKIDKFVTEKIAAVAGGKSLAKALTLPGAILGAGGAAGAAGYVTGKKKGKEKGYNKALEDVNRAFASYAGR